jgi:hypothetical protein
MASPTNSAPFMSASNSCQPWKCTVWATVCVFSKFSRIRSPSSTRIVGPGTPHGSSPCTGSTPSPSAQKAHTVSVSPG